MTDLSLAKKKKKKKKKKKEEEEEKCSLAVLAWCLSFDALRFSLTAEYNTLPREL